MAAFSRSLVSLACAQAAFGAYQCQTGYQAAAGDPACAGAAYHTCALATCCTATKYCSDSPSWMTNGKCAAGDSKMFFDLKKAGIVVATAAADADIKASCCTLASDAKCSDWVMLCPAGQLKKLSGESINAPAFPVDGLSIQQAKFTTACCETKDTCTSKGGALYATGITQCLALDKQFFDLHKLSNRFDGTGDSGVENMNAACCTPFSQALCSDWTLKTASCASGLTKVGTKSAAADGADGKTLTDAKYLEYCCVGKATCSSYSCPDKYDSKVGTTKCPTYMEDSCTTSTCCTAKATCGENSGTLYITGIAECTAESKMFFDLKKRGEMFVESTDAAVTKANRIAACCTLRANAKCSDWSTVTTCAANTFDAGPTVGAPPDGADGITLTEAKYRELCCVAAVSCANAVEPDLNSALTSSVGNTAILAGIIMQFLM